MKLATILLVAAAFIGGYFTGFQHQGGITSNFRPPEVPQINPFSLYGERVPFMEFSDIMWVRDDVNVHDITIKGDADGKPAEIYGNNNCINPEGLR